ncbi:MAG TPA: hypothetical protein VN634_04200 [Candidatus Limnocylindrales bacterium]|nr:hypothetical protein [Candidatus Limnocylindrales bacterium]
MLRRRFMRFILTKAGILLLAVTLCGWSGCAQVKHHPVDSFDQVQGIPYYLGSWYLLLYPDGKGAVKSSFLYMMDPRFKMEARPRAWFASVESLLKLDGGVLTATEMKADTTAVPSFILKAAEKAATSMVANDVSASRGEETVTSVPAPSIYRIDVQAPSNPGDATIVTFVGEQSDFLVEVY